MKSPVVYLVIGCMCLRVAAVQANSGQLPHHFQLRLLESQIHSGIAKPHLQFMVISDRSHFVEIYTNLHAETLPKPSLPEVDFATQRVLVAFMGQKSTAGYAIQFEEIIVQRDDNIEVTVRRRIPPPGAILAQIVTNPYVMAVVDKGAYTQVKFVNEDGHVLDVLDVK